MTATKYLTLDGLSYFKGKCDATYRTETQVNSQIDSKLATYKQNVVQIVSTVPTTSTAQEGYLYLVVDTNDQSGTVYTAYALENVDVSGTPTPTIVQVGSGTFVPETVDSALDTTSTNAIQNGPVATAISNLQSTKLDAADVDEVENTDIDALFSSGSGGSGSGS